MPAESPTRTLTRSWVESHNQSPRVRGLDAGIHRGAKALHDMLRHAGAKNVVFRDLEGQGHEWQTWRYAFHDFAPRLFQPKR